ncbi:MAG: hypothetical protein WC678_01690 [Parcubacteria group bacterium]|jgi:hypothetical protein
MGDKLSKKDAILFLGIPKNNFENYSNASEEIIGEKIRNRWYFDKNYLEEWNKLKKERTIELKVDEYEKCFEFAIKMVYGGLSLNGIRGQRTEVQAADDVILGILAEHAIKNFLLQKFSKKIKLDESVHPEEITPQDFDLIEDDKGFRIPKLGVGVKASKMKSAFLVLGSNEVELAGRKSDVYIFARVGLPSDHLFRILRDHSFFGKVRKFLDENKNFKKINKLEKIPVWICGFIYANELEKVTEIPGQKFDKGHRYVKSVGKLYNSDSDWNKLLSKL